MDDKKITDMLKREEKIKEILKAYDKKIKAYAVLSDTIESIRSVLKS